MDEQINGWTEGGWMSGWLYCQTCRQIDGQIDLLIDLDSWKTTQT